jgi:uncharacterized protein
MADRYAAELTRRGLIALSFDFTGFGLSGGQPREVDSPALKARDIHHAVTYLQDRADVDPDAIGALGICASAGYTVANATRDRRVRALALIAPWLHNSRIVEEVYGGPAGVAERLRAGQAALDDYQDGSPPEYVPAADPADPQAAMPMAIDFYLDPRRGAIRGWPNRFAVVAWTEWLRFDPIALAPQVAAPTLIVHSHDGAVPDGARQSHDALTCAKEIIWTQGTQFDFYDRPATVADAADLAAVHLSRHFKPGSALVTEGLHQ